MVGWFRVVEEQRVDLLSPPVSKLGILANIASVFFLVWNFLLLDSSGW